MVMTWVAVYPQPPLISYRHGRNLQDILVHTSDTSQHCCWAARDSKLNVRKLNSIKSNPSIVFDWARQSNQIEHWNLCEYDFRTNRIQSNKLNLIVLNPLDCVPLSLATEHNRTWSIGVCWIVSGELQRLCYVVWLPAQFSYALINLRKKLSLSKTTLL